jgi:hypothetical protein
LSKDIPEALVPFYESNIDPVLLGKKFYPDAWLWCFVETGTRIVQLKSRLLFFFSDAFMASNLRQVNLTFVC